MSLLNLPDNLTDFSRIEYMRPDMKKLSDAFRRCRLRLRLSMSAHATIDAVKELQQPLLDFATCAAIARIKHDLQMSDTFWQTEVSFFDQAQAQVDQWTQTTYAAILDSRFSESIEKELGDSLIREADRLHKTVQERNLGDLSEENRLETAYTQKISEMRVSIGGREYTLSEIEPILQSRDASLRRAAHTALNNAFENEHDWLDKCFSQMVSVRNRMSRKLGYTDFSQMGYYRMGRVDYGKQEVAAFRESVRKYVVPVCQEIRRLQRIRLKLSDLYYWDLPCLLPEGNPVPMADRNQWVKLTGQKIADLLKEPSYLTLLDDYGYIDLNARPDKAGGAYCSTLYTKRLPFILSNATKTANDIITLIHEAGHAYASLSSIPSMKVYEDQKPAMDICEIHSTALEYLTMPLLTDIFGDDTETAAMIHMTESLLFLPYACLVDHFQHEIYEHPEMSPEQRHSCWRTLEKMYQPDIDYGDNSWFDSGGAWQKKEHIFTAPFYYIDYALAHIVSMDLWSVARKDKDKAVRRYKRLCHRGNDGTFLYQLEESGIASPFSEETFKRLIYSVCDYLSL